MKTVLRIIIAGSSDFDNYDLLSSTLQDYLKDITSNDITIISGTAKGADQLGKKYARDNDIPITRFPADWDKYGLGAGLIRNKAMAEYAAQEQGVLFAFWNGKSKGTKSMINFAKKYGLEVHIIRY